MNLIILNIYFIYKVSASEWNYAVEGPDEWPHFYAKCGGQSQSPINIISAESHHDEELEEFHFYNYDHVYTWNMTYNNHTGI